MIDKIKCTGCMACKIICPKQCISVNEDYCGSLYPQIDDTLCIHCGQCDTVCHIINDENLKNYPQKVYAGLSNNSTIYKKATSGGIASEIYRYCLESDIFCVGTVFDRKRGVFYRQIKNLNDIELARGSKYVFSNMEDVYSTYEKKLKDKKGVFIGLPCQVAALKKFLKRKDLLSNIILIDLICHGVPSFKNLDHHLKKIEQKKGKIHSVSFRGPGQGYVLRCFDEIGKQVYRRYGDEDDAYYCAFNKNLNLRDSCYECQYAGYERVGDFSLGDYSGLGKTYAYDGIIPSKGVSLILVNTDKGQEFLSNLDNRVSLTERPIDEPLQAVGNVALHHPAVPNKNRTAYKEQISAENDIDSIIIKLMKKDMMRGRVKRYCRKVKRFLMRKEY